jgi:hypothetical protein
MGTVSFLGVKSAGRGVDHPPPYSAEVKERVELYLYSTSGPSWPELNLYLLYRLQVTNNGRSTFPSATIAKVNCKLLSQFK